MEQRLPDLLRNGNRKVVATSGPDLEKGNTGRIYAGALRHDLE